jgi:DNA-binding NarL/FixJ family response regulator
MPDALRRARVVVRFAACRRPVARAGAYRTRIAPAPADSSRLLEAVLERLAAVQAQLEALAVTPAASDAARPASAASSSPETSATLAPASAARPDALSEREREVLGHVAQGASNKEIARELGLSPHTVKRHVANILAKLGCATRREAVRAAGAELGW